jgi:protein-S-isoprenylcysteine O-methyltransferase Ste14
MDINRVTPFLVVQSFIVVGLTGYVLLSHGEWNVYRWIAVAIALPSIVLFLIARYQLGRSFSVTAQAHELVTHGIYSKIRNPIYVFGGLIILAFLLTLQKPVFLLILLVMIPVQVKRARNEARVLEEKFGDAYREYRKKTWF